MAISKRKAMHAAIENAAALIECMDLDQLFGDAYFAMADEPDAEKFATEAQAKLVARIRKMNRGASHG